MSEAETRVLEVIQEDIDAANGRTSATGCPFAQAAKRLFPGWDSVTVAFAFMGQGSADIHLNQWAERAFEQWLVDEAGTAAVRRYDAGEAMEPGSYTLTFVKRQDARKKEKGE